MCRIFGLVDPQLNTLDAERIASNLSTALHHGGPDGAFRFHQDGLVMGSTRIAIMDPEHGDQPFRGAGFTVFYNGEIYNSLELRKHLLPNDFEQLSSCDGAILPEAIARYGERAVDELDGMFAIAAWNDAQRQLTLMRDPVGIKPLFVFNDNGRFGFASEIPALLQLRARKTRANPAAIDAYLRHKAVFGMPVASNGLWQTAIEGVYAVPPGAVLQIDRNAGLKVLRTSTPLVTTLDRVDVDILANVFESAVESVSKSDVDVCSILSGGLDSSIVTGLIAAQRRAPLNTFFVHSGRSGRFDERPFAREVAAANGTTHHEVQLDTNELLTLLPVVARHLGQPNADPITASTYVLFKAVADANFKVALSGDGSDEVFGGYGRFVEALHGGTATSYVDALAGVSPAIRMALYDESFITDRSVDYAALSPDFIIDPLRATTEFEIRNRMPVYHLERVDALSSAHGIEVRVPFCQREVVALGRSLPADKKIDHEGRVKRLLTETARELEWTPASVWQRKKQPFTFRLSENLAGSHEFMTWATGVVLDPAADRGYFRRDAIEKLAFNVGAGSGEDEALAFWSLLMLELWHREVVDAHVA